MDSWMIWVGVGLICMIIEIFTPGFLFMSFGVGAIMTGVFSLIVPDLVFQILVFAMVTFFVFINLRKFSKKIISTSTEETNIFALKGKTGIVTKTIPKEERGYVKVGGEEWSAISKNKEKITENTRIIVESFEGNKLIVIEKREGE